MTGERLPTLIVTVVVFIVLAFAVSGTVADADLWGNIRYGQDILSLGRIPAHDPHSFTSDIPWINHEWLTEVAMALGYNVGGNLGLIALKLVLACALLTVLWCSLKAGGVFEPVAVALLLIATLGASYLFMTIRAQLFSALLLVIMLSLLNAVARGRTRLLLWMPALFGVWANLHGGWLVGLGVLSLWSACRLLRRTLTWQWAVSAPGLALAGTLANPYGLGLWRLLWETVGLSRPDIVEWQPLVRAPFLWLPWLMAAALVAAAWRRRGVAASGAAVPVVALGVLALLVARLEGFFALAAVILLSPSFASLGPRQWPLSRLPTRAQVTVVGILCAMAIVTTGFSVMREGGCISFGGVGESWAPEAEAVRFLRDNPIEGRLLCYFNYGHLAIWHLSPRLRVSYDGRRETVYSEAVQSAHQRFYGSSSDASYARTLRADYVWLPNRLPVIEPLRRDGWVEIFRGPRSVVLARAAGPYVQPAPSVGARCFPGP
jgi:hypothetical protein